MANGVIVPKFPPVKRLDSSEFPSEKSWIGRLLLPLNDFMLNVYKKIVELENGITNVNPYELWTTAGGQSITNDSTYYIVDYGELVKSSNNLVTAGNNWSFTAKESGLYAVIARIQYGNLAWAANNLTLFSTFVNGVQTSVLARHYFEAAVTTYFALGGSALLWLEAGDYLDVRAYHNRTAGAAAINTTNSRVGNYINIVKVSG
jgi:hypothetical protein